MTKRILVPVDGSEVAAHALEYLKDIAPAGSTITLLTALDVPEYSVAPYYPVPVAYEVTQDDLAGHLLPQAKDYLQATAQRLEQRGYKVEMQTVISEPAKAIVDIATESKIDAIVMTTHGRSGLSKWLLGSVASKVLNATPCPVYIIPMRHWQKEDPESE